MSHGDKVSALPEGFRLHRQTRRVHRFAAIENRTRNLFGVQFHPEVTHTDKGEALIRRFARDLCGCQGDWTPANIVDDAIASIRDHGGRIKLYWGYLAALIRLS